uniref:Uncharacterized protein n=1 Tax=Ditylenchus dipsaci TaxID=166011 RepID=A0A915DZN7_9BILA
MEKFSWENADVMEKLQQRKDGKLTDADVQSFLSSKYNKDVKRVTISRHLPVAKTVDSNAEVIELKTKFGGSMLATRNGENYRVYIQRDNNSSTYRCMDCFVLRRKLNLAFLMPLVSKSKGQFMQNDGIHHEKCRCFDYNTLMAQNVDRKWRENAASDPLMNPQQAFEHGRKEAMELSKKRGECGKRLSSARIKFPDWTKCRIMDFNEDENENTAFAPRRRSNRQEMFQQRSSLFWEMELALSFCLFGSEEYHAFVRSTIADYLQKHKGEAWCGIFIPDLADQERHIEDMTHPAKDASEVEKWAENYDLQQPRFSMLTCWSGAAWDVHSTLRLWMTQ